MILLHNPRFPERPVPVEAVRDAWLAAGFKKFGTSSKKPTLVGEEVRGIVNAQLLAGGATLTGVGSTDFEVPDEMEPLLGRLQDFYLRLYPEMRSAPAGRTFNFEKVEWLGEF